MRRRRGRLVLLSGAVAVAVAALVVAAGHPVPTEERAGRIRPGMTRAVAEAALGDPPGNHGAGPVLITPEMGNPPTMTPRRLYWWYDDGRVRVEFDEAGRAERVQFLPNPAPPTALARCARWVGRWLS